MSEYDGVENVAASLVREYLSRKGLKVTLKAMDVEMPRTELSISNRLKLAEECSLLELTKKNKDRSVPYRAMLEIMTKYFMEKRLLNSATSSGNNITDQSPLPSCSGQAINTTSPAKQSSPPLDSLSTSPNYNNTSNRSTSTSPSSMSRKSPPSSAGHMTKLERPTTRDLQQRTHRNDEMILEDADDCETILGSGVMASARYKEPDMVNSPGGVRVKKCGMVSGPITSNLDERERQKVRKSINRPTFEPTKPVQNLASYDKKLTSSFVLKGNYPKKSANQIIDDSSQNDKNMHSLLTNSRNSDLLVQTQRNNDRRKPESLADILATSEKRKQQLNSTNDESGDILSIGILGKSLQRSSLSKKGVISARKGSRDYTKTTGSHSSESQSSDIRVDANRRGSLRRTDDISSEGYDIQTSSISNRPPTRSDRRFSADSSESKPSKPTVNTVKVGDLEIGDVDDFDNEFENVEIRQPVVNHTISQTSNSKPITLQTAIELKVLIFGSALTSFNQEWRSQGYTFSEVQQLQYGIVQRKGGPCGVLAAVQACFLEQILFHDPDTVPQRRLNRSGDKRSRFLAVALAGIFWRAGDKQQAIVALSSSRSHFTGGGKYKSDQLTETLILNTFTSYVELESFMMMNISQFESEGSAGVVLSLYSAILSRSIQTVRADIDEVDSKLMGAHGYCTQDMVNLFLVGYAASNVFNDTVELEGASDSPSLVLKGIRNRSDIGLLSLFEHYKSCQVGTYLKTPKYPIWVVCSESHFSVLFSTKKELTSDWKAERRFDLYYYDGLANQDEEIRLTIDTTNRFYEPPSEDDLIPPLELCIRTKWAGACVDWNATEPLL